MNPSLPICLIIEQKVCDRATFDGLVLQQLPDSFRFALGVARDVASVRGAYLFDANANLMLAGEKQELDHTVRFNAKQIQAIADTVGGVAAIIVVDDIVKYSKPGSPLKTVAKKRKYLPDVDDDGNLNCINCIIIFKK